MRENKLGIRTNNKLSMPSTVGIWIQPFKIQKYLKSGLFEGPILHDQIFEGLGFSYSCGPPIWKPDRSKSGHFCLDFNWHLIKLWLFVQKQQIFYIKNFRFDLFILKHFYADLNVMFAPLFSFFSILQIHNSTSIYAVIHRTKVAL